MMPELGKYATEVLAAYGISLLLLTGLLVLTLRRGRRVRAELDRIERNERRG